LDGDLYNFIGRDWYNDGTCDTRPKELEEWDLPGIIQIGHQDEIVLSTHRNLRWIVFSLHRFVELLTPNIYDGR
jgi:hypothetical protein